MYARKAPRVGKVVLLAVLISSVRCHVYAQNAISLGPCPEQDSPKPSHQEESAAKSAEWSASEAPKRARMSVDWESMIPSIRAIFNRGRSPEQMKQHRYPVRIVQEADITGDGLSEVLVTTGDFGASTDILAVIRLEDDKPVLARFKDAKGKIVNMEFVQGTSMAHGSTTGLLPDEKAVYMGGYFMNDTGTGFSSCGAAAYRWNGETSTFDLDPTLSKQMTKTYCEREAKALLPQ